MGTSEKGPRDEVSIHVDAPPEHIWDMVADVTRMGEWSPECYRCHWQGEPRAPAVGARFVGHNKAGWRRWRTRNVVVEAERGEVFAFRTVENRNVWSYRMEPDGDAGGGTTVTEARQLPAKRPWYGKLALYLAYGGLARHDVRMRAGMQRTLERLKAAAETA
jgi:polyketide cyclase/dehydrase/lipid transport protein